MIRHRIQSGQSLVVVMIGLSIVSIVLLTVFKLLDMSRDMVASFQTVLKAMDAVQEVRFALADPVTCTTNLKGYEPGPIDKPFVMPKKLFYVSRVGAQRGNGSTAGGPNGGSGTYADTSGGAGAVSGVASTPYANPPGGPSPGPAPAPSPSPATAPPIQTGNPQQEEIIAFGGLGDPSIVVTGILLSLPPTPTPGAMTLSIEMSRRGLGYRMEKMRTRSLPVWIKTDAAGVITCCSTRSLSACP